MILQIDSDWDEATNYGFQFRVNKYVLPYFEKSFIVTKLFGNSARRNNFMNEVKREDIYYVSGFGHGAYDEFTGHNGETLWKISDNIPVEEVSGKIIHLLSCQAGKLLGVNLVAKGAKCYFGYTENFIFVIDPSHTGNIVDDPYSDPFFRADSEIDRRFVDGLSAKEVHEKVINLYEDLIDEWTERDWYVAAYLNWDREHLCSPVIDSKWGAPEACLEILATLLVTMGLGISKP